METNHFTPPDVQREICAACGGKITVVVANGDMVTADPMVMQGDLFYHAACWDAEPRSRSTGAIRDPWHRR